MKKHFFMAVLLATYMGGALAQNPPPQKISGKVSMIDSRVNSFSSHYVVIRLKSAKIDATQVADAAVLFSVPKDKDNAAGFPADLKMSLFQGQSCLDLAKQAFAMGKSFFVATNGGVDNSDNGTVLKADTANRFTNGASMTTYFVLKPTQNAMWVPASCGIEN